MLLDRLYKWMDLLKTGKSQQATDQILRRVKVKLHSPIYLTYWLMILSLIFYEFKEIQVPIFVISVLYILAIKGSILLFE